MRKLNKLTVPVRDKETAILKDYFRTLPYGEACRIKEAIIKKESELSGKTDISSDEHRAAKRQIENWLQGTCRIPFMAKVAINEVVGFPLLLPYSNYKDIISQLDDATLLDYLPTNKEWCEAMCRYYGLKTDVFFSYLQEFKTMRLGRHYTMPKVEDCLNHLNNWLRSCKKLKCVQEDCQMPPYPYGGI